MMTGFFVGLLVLIGLSILDGFQHPVTLTEIVVFCGGGAAVGYFLS